jgi:hypothetical protein
VLLARSIRWDKLAKSLSDNMVDPDHLFRWPLARVLAVYFADDVRTEEVIDATDPATRAAVLKRIREQRRAKRGGE